MDNFNTMPFVFPVNFMQRMMGQSSVKEEPPARVQLAMEYVRYCMTKTMQRAACIDQPGGIELIPGEALSGGEKDTQVAACLCLENYFNGDLKPSQWDNFEVNTQNKSVSKYPGMIIRCMVCSPGPGRSDCVLCKGCGNLFVQPTMGEGIAVDGNPHRC